MGKDSLRKSRTFDLHEQWWFHIIPIFQHPSDTNVSKKSEINIIYHCALLLEYTQVMKQLKGFPFLAKNSIFS